MERIADFCQGLLALLIVAVIYGGLFALIFMLLPPGWIFLIWLLFW